jgi:hypothetical protein
MPCSIAEQTGGNDVARVIPTPVAAGDKMFSCTLKSFCISNRNVMLSGKLFTVAFPHWKSAIPAAEVLFMGGSSPQRLNAHAFPLVGN